MTMMFTLNQIEAAHQKVKSGADFPKYIQEIKNLGVLAFETRVLDSQTIYFGSQDFKLISAAIYDNLIIEKQSNKQEFIVRLKKHQNGETDYFTFCKDCAETGVEKWKMDLQKMTCTYYDLSKQEILVEQVPI